PPPSPPGRAAAPPRPAGSHARPVADAGSSTVDCNDTARHWQRLLTHFLPVAHLPQGMTLLQPSEMRPQFLPAAAQFANGVQEPFGVHVLATQTPLPPQPGG